MGKTTKIIDNFTDLNVSRQRKWQLRHPEAQKAIWKRYAKKTRAKYLLKNREKLLKWQREYHAKNREHNNEKARQYYIKRMLEE